MYKLRSERISQQLFWSMILIIFSLLLLSVPLIVSSYKSYQKADRALSEISALRAVADLANKISRERAPANKVMSSRADELAAKLKELDDYRKEVDLQIEQTIRILNTRNFSGQEKALFNNLKKSLQQGRQAVDAYAALPLSQRNSEQFDNAIQQMFKAWDSCYEILKNELVQSEGKGTAVSEYYTLILILSDLRDQAGRMASNVIAPVTFKEKMSEDNLARSLQTQHQAIPIAAGLIDESLHNQPYSLTGTQLTEVMVDKFVTVVNLQSYILDYSVHIAQKEKQESYHIFILTLLVALICLVTAFFTMIYARNGVFKPLIDARNSILQLAQYKVTDSDYKNSSADPVTLLDAIQKLKGVLQQRDALEFQLRNIANTDTLTGVSNRLALDEYIKYVERKPEKFTQIGLIIFDIDDFKQVNDTFGHIVGDEVIRLVAEKLQFNVRTSDLIVRYGGDEFLVLIEQIHFHAALVIANKMLNEIADSELYIAEINQNIQISVSAGVAVGAVSWMALLEKADKSLFKAKARGKNAVDG